MFLEDKLKIMLWETLKYLYGIRKLGNAIISLLETILSYLGIHILKIHPSQVKLQHHKIKSHTHGIMPNKWAIAHTDRFRSCSLLTYLRYCFFILQNFGCCKLLLITFMGWDVCCSLSLETWCHMIKYLP